MQVAEAAVRDLRPLLTSGRAALVDLLSGLSSSAWRTPTEAGHWTVGDVARHLLDDDLGMLSRGRDGDLSGLIPGSVSHQDLVATLDAKNERWVSAAAGLSARVVTDLLAWSGAAVDAFLATIPLDAPRHVSWAGGAVPAWVDVARELTERWVHGRHIADAVGAVVDPDPVRAEVLRTFVWAFPAQLGPAAEDAVVGVALGDDRWSLRRSGSAWSLDVGRPSRPVATLALDAEPAWRHLTGLPVAAGAVRTTGDPDLVARLLAVRSIIV
ncbi:MAG TPA: maleylpyruvate isomerase family mycothiol-dependent enzyme [Iamia sp.]|nr:maleylpyruvate isomerase family mycothiol-dependent enzyme [Iamia sp.]